MATLTKTVNDLKRARKEAEEIEATTKKAKIAKEGDQAKDVAKAQEKAAKRADADCEDCGSAGLRAKIRALRQVIPLVITEIFHSNINGDMIDI